MFSSMMSFIGLGSRSKIRVALLAIASTVSATAEAAFMALVAIAATGLAGDTQNLGPISVVGFSVSLSIEAALWAMVGSLALRTIAQVGVVYLPVRLSGDVQLALRRRLVGAYIHASWARQADQAPGTIQELATGHVSQVSEMVRKVAEGVAALITILILVSASFLTNPTAASFAVVVPLAVSIVLRPLTRAVRRESGHVSAASLDLADRLREVSRFLRLAHTFGTYAGHEQRIDESALELRRRYIRARALSKSVPALYQFMILSGIIAGLWITARAGNIALASVGAVVLLLLRAAAYGQQLQASYQAINELSAFGVRLSDIVQGLEADARREGEREFSDFERITVAALSFDYDGASGEEAGQTLLRDVTLTIERGEAVAIVGRSGSGKSTLADLLAGLLAPKEGTILVDGVDLGDFSLETIARHVAYVPQESPLLDDTVTENIRYLRSGISDDEIIEAARLAGIADEVLSWPEGFATLIGDEHGRRISGGQRKRMGLARALAGGPSILILDEPTSSLDASTETSVARALAGLRGHVTMLIVTHSAELLPYCDRALEMSGGVLAPLRDDSAVGGEA